MKNITNYAVIAAPLVRQITGFSNYYASTEGQIYRAKTVKGKFTLTALKQKESANGYDMYTLTDDNGVRMSVQAGRLVLQAFYPTANFETHEPDHIDNNPLNNNLNNLRWLTHSENVKRARNKKKTENSYLKNRPIYTISYDENGFVDVNQFCSRSAMIHYYKMTTGTATRVLKGQQSNKYNIWYAFYCDELENQCDKVQNIIYDFEYLNKLF